MPDDPITKLAGGKGPKADKRKKLILLGVAVVAVIVFVLIRRSSSSSSSTVAGTDPNAIDPSTGLTYGEEAAQSSGIDPATGVPYAQELAAAQGGGSGTTSGGSDGTAIDPTAEAGVSALSQQFDSLSSYAQGLASQEATDEQSIAALSASGSSAIDPSSGLPYAQELGAADQALADTATSAGAAPAGSTTKKVTSKTQDATSKAANAPGAKPAAVVAPKTVSATPKHVTAAVEHAAAPKPAPKPAPAPKITPKAVDTFLKAAR